MLTRRQHVLLWLPFALLVIPCLLLPLAAGFGMSFTDYRAFASEIAWVGWRNYARILQDDIFRRSIVTLALFTLAIIPGALALGCGLALALRRHARTRGWLRLSLLLPWLISPVGSGVMWHYLLSMENGIVNTIGAYLGVRVPYLLSNSAAVGVVIVAEIWRTAPLVTFLVLPGMINIPAEHWDQARMDGLSSWGRWQHVALPHLLPLILTTTLLTAGTTLGMSESLLYLTGGGPGTLTMTPGLYSYRRAISVENPLGGAVIGWLVALLIIALGSILTLYQLRKRDHAGA